MKKFAAIILAVGIIGLCVVALAHASNVVGVSVSLCGNKTGCPAATQTPAPTPTPSGGGGPLADPNANQATVNEYHYLQSLESAGSRHLIIGNTDAVRGSFVGPLATEVANNYASNGNQYDGMSSDDFCNGFWGDTSTPMCAFGTGSDAYQGMLNAWNRGELVHLSIHFPNPFDNYLIQAPGSAKSTSCPQLGNIPVIKGLSDDCYSPSGNIANDVLTMLQPGTQYNNQWNTELNNWVTMLQDLQSAGVVVIVRIGHEMDFNQFWWSTTALQNPSAYQQWFAYTEHYFESHGIHNALYEYAPLGGVIAYPGNQYVDICGHDDYPPANGFTLSLYTQLQSTCGGKPQSAPEYSASASGGCAIDTTDYGQYFRTYQSTQPNTVFVDHWAGPNPGSVDSGKRTGCTNPTSNPYWTGDMTNPYLALQPSTSARPR